MNIPTVLIIRNKYDYKQEVNFTITGIRHVEDISAYFAYNFRVRLNSLLIYKEPITFHAKS